MSIRLQPVARIQAADYVTSFLTSPLDPLNPTTSVLTEEQVAQMKQLRYIDGTQILTVEDPYFLNDILALVVAIGFDETYAFLSMEDGFADKKHLLKLSPMLAVARQREQMEIASYRPIPKKGFYTCACGSENTVTIERQSRSGDEALKQEVKCMDCDRKWNVQ